jgi:hypothetical protein
MARKEHFLMGFPYLLVGILVITNTFTGALFEVKDGVYYRGPFIMVIYVVAAIYMIVSVFYFFIARTGRKKTKILGGYYIFSCVKCVKIQSAWSPFGLTGDWMK